jgi:5'-nucleotidase
MAVSLDAPENHSGPLDYRSAARAARCVAQVVLEHGLPHGVLLNVNVPGLGFESLKGVAVTRQGLRVYRDALVRREDPRGRPYYWIGGESPTGVAEAGTDFWALREGFVSVTPLQLDLTAHRDLSTLESWGLSLA